jgi:tricorn protease-like protein
VSNNRIFSLVLIGVLVVVLSTSQTCLAAEPKQLTRTGTIKFTPTFVAQGKQIAYVEMIKPNQFQLLRMTIDSLKVEPFHRDDGKHELDLAVSSDDKHFAFIKCHGALNLSLEIHDARDNKVGNVPHAGGFAGYLSPEFAPDSSHLLFVFADAEAQQDIYSVNLQGKERKQITSSGGINNWPSYSPDGRRIVFGSTRDENYEIYVMNADGSDVRRLTISPTMDVRPEFSPDGKRICFTSNRNGNYEIYVMNADGSNQTRVTTSDERDDYATWHPSGKYLAVVSERNGKHDLYLHDLPSR